MQNPFTTTFSKAPENTYIATDEPQNILDNFSYALPAENVYKITGVRGSGKTVILGKVEQELSQPWNQENGWIVYRLNPSRDMLNQLSAYLHRDGFANDVLKRKSINVSASVLGTGGGFGISPENEDHFFDIGVEINEMLKKVAEKGKKILIGIDEVSKTKDMITFAGEYGNWLRAGYPVYLVCTGLYENIQELANVKNLTFFRRATTIQTGPLNSIRMASMYKEKLGIGLDLAKKFSATTKGYAYAFQELGTLYFNRKNEDSEEDIIDKLKTELYAYSYEKIWEELTAADRSFLKNFKEDREYKREELINAMPETAGSYSVYRDRLLKRGILTARQGYLSLALPFFSDYMKEYC